MDVFLDPDQPRRTSAMLFDQIRDAISTGRLPPGDQLPPSRALAADLGVSRSTVAAVYRRMVAEGILDARVGDGTFVAEHHQRVPDGDPASDSVLVARRKPASAAPRRPAIDVVVDLRTGRPYPALFPLTAWRRAVAEAVEAPPPGYGDAAGLPALRTAIATAIRRSRGLALTADQILVTAGARQGFDLCARILVAPGDVVAFEEPGYEPARRAFIDHGAVIQPVPVDRDGLVVDAIESSARLVFVTPSHQSPTGVTMSAQRRRDLLAMADDLDLAIVEDDYDTEYRYVDRPLEPLHRLDLSGRVVYVGTFSKTLSPSLRLGFIAANPALIVDLTGARSIADGQPPHLTQAALAHLIVTGGLDRHIRQSRKVYRRRHNLVETRIGSLHAAGLVPTPWRSNAGLHTILRLHATADADTISDQLAESGILIETTRHNWHGDPQPGLAIGYGLADLQQLDRAFDALTTVLRATTPEHTT